MKIPEAAGYMFEYVQNIESHAGFCSEHFPSLAPALSEKLGAWRKEDEFGKVIRVTTYFATKVQDPEKTKENLRKMREPLESLSNEKRVASCQGFLRAFQAKKWREWRSDPRFQVLEEFDFWIHPH